jgi:hypothetical protein
MGILPHPIAASDHNTQLHYLYQISDERSNKIWGAGEIIPFQLVPASVMARRSDWCEDGLVRLPA